MSGTTKPMERVGTASPTEVELATTFCLGATGDAAVDAALGLPGPGTARPPATPCTEPQCP